MVAALCNDDEDRKTHPAPLQHDLRPVGTRTFDSKPRENDETERQATGVGRDMSCPRKLIFNPPEVSFFSRKSVLRDVRMQSCLAHRFLVTLRPPLHEIFAFFFKHQIEEGLDANVSEDCLLLKRRLPLV